MDLGLHRRSPWLSDLWRHLDCVNIHPMISWRASTMWSAGLSLGHYLASLCKTWLCQVLEGHKSLMETWGLLSKLTGIYILYIHQEREICLCSHVYSFCWKPNIPDGDSDPEMPPHFSPCQTQGPATPSAVRIQQGFQVLPSTRNSTGKVWSVLLSTSPQIMGRPQSHRATATAGTHMEISTHRFQERQDFLKLRASKYFMQNTELQSTESAALCYQAGAGQVAQRQRGWLLA